MGLSAAVGPWKRLTFATTATAAALALAFGWALLRSEPPLPVERFVISFGPGHDPALVDIRGLNLSPDGSMLVYQGPGEQAGTQLWVRRFEDLESSRVRGTAVSVTLPRRFSWFRRCA